jgi:tetratricopeptide (TPR) repeat protein
MRAALAFCALALAACAAEDPALAAERNWARCGAEGDANQRLQACTALIDAPATTRERRAAALMRRGETRLELGQYVRAIGDFGRVLRLEPRNAQALFQRGMAHYDRGAYAIAGRDFDAVLALDPAHEEALHWRANVTDDLVSQFDNQIAQIGTLIQERPGESSLRNSRCWLRVTHNRELPEALADCNEALRLDPKSAAALDSRGLVHYKLGDFEASLADYDAALALEAERGHYMFGRGLALQALGRAEEADAAFAAAESAEPGVAELYRSYGAGGPT